MCVCVCVCGGGGGGGRGMRKGKGRKGREEGEGGRGGGREMCVRGKNCTVFILISNVCVCDGIDKSALTHIS